MFSTNYLFKDKGIIDRCPKNKQEGIKTSCPENKQVDSNNCFTPKIQRPSANDNHRYSDLNEKEITTRAYASKCLIEGDYNYNIQCKICDAQNTVSATASKHRCWKCKANNFLTPKIHDDEQPSGNDHLRCSLRAFASKDLINDKGFNESPYTGSLNDIHRSSSKRSNKRALLCGVTYYNERKYKLKGSVNDVINMKDLLMNQFRYPAESIRVMTEYEKDQKFIPTKQNIKSALKWLVEGCKAGDSLVFYFSGHGLRQPDFQNDEKDGYDETICPVDFLQEGMIFDNDINKDIVKLLKKGVTLHAIVDACHSGTILDLIHVYNPREGKWTDNSLPSGVPKGTSGGLAICLNACNDDKMAADTSAFTSGKVLNGAMPYILIQTLKQNPDITYGSLLQRICEAMQVANSEWCLKPKIFKKMFCQNINQEPLLSSSEKFDVRSKKFIL